MIFSILLITAAIFNMSACSDIALKVQAADLMDGIASESISEKTTDDHFIRNSANFSIELFKKTVKD